MDLIDTHLHMIERNRFGYSWTSGIPALATGDFTGADYRALTEDTGVIGALFMETGVDDADYQAEARWIASQIGHDGLLGQIASCRPEDATGFEAWLAECDGLGVKGFRRILHVMPDELSASGTFRANLKAIGRRGLPFDVCVLQRQLPLALDLARACDDQTLVLDHCGVPELSPDRFADWARAIDALAALPHVHAKLSGISAYGPPEATTAAALKPWVDHLIARFGPDRLVWGGDWPVVNLGAGLPAWIETTDTLLAALSQTERQKIGTETARRVYRL